MRNWRTTFIGALLAGVTFLGVYQSNGGDLSDWRLWVLPFLVQVLGYFAKDAGVTGSLKILFFFLLPFFLMSCAMDAQGKKTFAGLNSEQWQGIGMTTGGAYFDAKRQERIVYLPSSKTAADVTPAPVSTKVSYWDMARALFGY